MDMSSSLHMVRTESYISSQIRATLEGAFVGTKDSVGTGAKISVSSTTKGVDEVVSGVMRAMVNQGIIRSCKSIDVAATPDGNVHIDVTLCPVVGMNYINIKYSIGEDRLVFVSEEEQEERFQTYIENKPW